MTATQSSMPQQDWDRLLKVYNQRANLDAHRNSARLAGVLAATYESDRDIQIFTAQTAYYLAHRLKNQRERQTVALTGLDAARRVLRQDPSDYDGRLWHALTTFKAREAEGIKAALKGAKDARKYLEEMMQDRPERFEAYMLLGAFYRELPPIVSFGDKKKALRLLEKAASLAPEDPEVLLELAASYRKVGRKQEARDTYRKVIDGSTAPRFREWESEDARQYARKMLSKILF